jgi:murein DD-endopeptidase MepM/ murein hydrolase activator NlpD
VNIVREPVVERKAETQGGYAMTREEKNLSDDFSNNRGSLPVPVAGRYILISRYGTQQHGDLKHVVTNNNGIDLQADPGTDARVVFKGVVSKVFAVPGFNSSVIVRHGNFLTVYSNLSRVYVGAGDRVSTRQSIGKIYSDPDEGNRTVLHFQVWKEMTKQNPQIWLNF